MEDEHVAQRVAPPPNTLQLLFCVVHEENGGLNSAAWKFALSCFLCTMCCKALQPVDVVYSAPHTQSRYTWPYKHTRVANSWTLAAKVPRLKYCSSTAWKKFLQYALMVLSSVKLPLRSAGLWVFRRNDSSDMNAFCNGLSADITSRICRFLYSGGMITLFCNCHLPGC